MKSIKLNVKNTKLRIINLLIICVFISTTHGCFNEEKSSAPKSEITAPTPEKLANAIKQSANYLKNATHEDGMFEYRINMNPNIKVTRKYNILRHAGTIYAMAMYYNMYPDENILSAVMRAGAYLRDESILPISDNDNMLAVWSMPEINGSNNPLQTKLGGTGLGLVALLSIEKIKPGFTPLQKLKELGRSIVYMQKEDGSFYSRYIPSMGGLHDKQQCLFYPGEAALGLLMLYEKDTSAVWLNSAYKALEYLAISRKNSSDIPADHWALLATEKILSFKNSSEVPISRDLLINHAIQICETILHSQNNQPYQPKYDGGFSKDGKTTPSATRLEGLLAALSFLPKNLEIRDRISASIDRGIAFLIRSQIKEGKYSGAIPRATDRKREIWFINRSFNRNVTEVRIDYIQHAMSAMIKYQLLSKDA